MKTTKSCGILDTIRAMFSQHQSVFFLLTTCLCLTVSHPLDVVDSGSESEPAPQEELSTGRLFFQDHTPAGVLRVRAGEPFVLDCEAGGSPSPTVHFLRDGHRVIQGGDHDVLDDEARFENAELAENSANMAPLRLSSTKARLVLPCVTSRHQGEYTCVAETPYQRISTTTFIEVVPRGKGQNLHHSRSKHKKSLLSSLPHSQKRSLKHFLGARSKLAKLYKTEGTDEGESCMRKRLGADGAPARIHMWTSQRLEFEGSNVQLFCRPGGSPSPKITWYDRNDEKISPDQEQYKILGNGDLLIRNIQWFQHMGLYRCVAENADGTDEVNTFLYPTSP